MTQAHTQQLATVLLLCASAGWAQNPGPKSSSQDPFASFSTEAVGPNRFVAVHGRRALIMGYAEKGLEIWGYPFQILSDYQVGFQPAGATTVTDGKLLLRNIEYRADSVTRTYIGPDYLVREKLFVPLDQPAVMVSFDVEGIRQVDLQIRFVPVMNLMWPGALGGQYARWNVDHDDAKSMPALIIAEPERGYSAAIGSPELIAHDDIVNSTVRPDNFYRFSVRPIATKSAGPARATVFVALNPGGTKNQSEVLESLASQLPQLTADASAHYGSLAPEALRIRTPDENVNRALAWSVVALDQAWVCNELLGCGLVAGYGPSRDARRPQYAWFFGGDGLVATNALISAGQYSRAREELAFVQKYQDAKTGMIWHELSQSAGLIDWSKYPYMYVHVDISFDYLATLARFVAVTGDLAFADRSWASIEAAYRYCLSQINRNDHLPHIPPDKEASDEQHRPADDLGLAASWLAAANGYAELAKFTGHSEQAIAALSEAHAARASIPNHYWSADKNFWFDGHTASGEPIFRQAAGPTQLLTENVFPTQQQQAILDQITSADFQTDWGSREVAASSKDYNPYSYGAGSITAPGTANIAISFWQAHRPESALGLWNGLIQWNTLDSPGHLHEVLAGNFFHEETESVPEQTWSSAGLLDCTVRGLLGLEIDGMANRVRLAPHLPADWSEVSVDNIRLPHSVLSAKITKDDTNFDLYVHNEGLAVTLDFSPQIPLGARLLSAEFNKRKIAVHVEAFAGDRQATATLRVEPGGSRYHLRFTGGVAILLPNPTLHVGDASSLPKIVGLDLQGQTLRIAADIPSAVRSRFRIRTPWSIVSHAGVTVRALGRNEYDVEFDPPAQDSRLIGPTGYVHVNGSLSFTS